MSLDRLIEKQDSNLRKRVVHLIKNYPQPKEIFELINRKEYPYKSIASRPDLPVRDRAIMAMYYASAGRGAEVVGGKAYERSLPAVIVDGKYYCVVCQKELTGSQRKFCGKEHRKQIHTISPPKVLNRFHNGILAENIVIRDNEIEILSMEVVKRSQKVIDTYGYGATRRRAFDLPLKLDIRESPFYNQLVPFSYLVLEYLVKYAPKQGRLFSINAPSAYYIVRYITGNYLNWFRAQGKQFYGKYLFKGNAMELADFVNDQDPKSEREYTRYDWHSHVKDYREAMKFDWIKPAIDKIKLRIGKNLVKK